MTVPKKIAQKIEYSCIAYKKFLSERHISINRIPFDSLPLTDKDNYIKSYPLDERLYKNRHISDYYMICTSSGSTDEPTIWPRNYNFDEQLVPPHTAFLDSHFQITKKKTLILIALGLGTTQAGMMHLKASWGANKDGNVSVISPNGDAETTVFLLQKLYKEYDQILCLGYPPLISDFIDLAVQKKLPIKKWNLKIGVTSESVSPLWRKEMIKTIGGGDKNVICWYGSTEAGMIGFETPEANVILSHCLKDSKLRFALFHTYNLPTLVEISSMKKYIEVVEGEIVITVDQVVPLVRYNLHDRGMFITNTEIKKIMKLHGHDTKGIGTEEHQYLAVFGRKAKTIFSMEDIRYVIDQEHFYATIHNEFQFEETMKKDIHIITVTLYKRKHTSVSKEKIKTMEMTMVKSLKKIQDIHISLTIVVKNEEDRVGYKSGKLRYLLQQ